MTIESTRADFFPLTLPGGATVRSVDVGDAFDIAGTLAPRVFTPLPELGLVPYEPPAASLAGALVRHAEHLVFYDSNDAPIGWSIGDQREADTFFMMWTGILPAHQNRGLYSAFLRHFLEYCGALGYARVTSNHMVNNRRVIVAKMKAGFVASGFELDERWGAMLRLTYFIDEARAQGYERAFSLESYDD